MHYERTDFRTWNSATPFLRPSSILNFPVIFPFSLFLNRKPYIFITSWVKLLCDCISAVLYSICFSVAASTTESVMIGIICAGSMSFLKISKWLCQKKIINYVLKILIPCLGLNRDVFEVHAFALIQELFVSHADYIPFCLFQGQTCPLLKYCEKSTFYRPLKTYRFRQNRRCLRTSWCFRLTRIAKNTKPLLAAEQFSSYCFTCIWSKRWLTLLGLIFESFRVTKCVLISFPGYQIISNDNRLL